MSNINSHTGLNIKLSEPDNNLVKDNEIIFEKNMQHTDKYVIDGRNSDHIEKRASDFDWVSGPVEKDTDSNISSLESRTYDKESIYTEKSGSIDVYSSGPEIFFS